MRRCDVAVIGAGPAGAATAIALRRQGLSVTLIERHATPEQRPGETLAPAARVTLEALGVWTAFLGDHHVPVAGNRSIWGRPAPGEAHFVASAYGSGWHVDRRRFETRLQAVAHDSGATVMSGVTATHVAWDDTVWRLTVDDELEARFCVDATGRHSALARSCGEQRVAIDHLVGVTRFLERRHGGARADSFTLVEAVAEGWWYSAVLPEDRLVLAFMTDADLVTPANLTAASGLEAALVGAPQTRARVAGYAPLGPPRVCPAGTSRLGSPVGEAWLAVGDAAAAYDPLSSCGIETALRGGLRSAEAIAAHLKGDARALHAYASETLVDFGRYLVERALQYQTERRFESAPFWRRRQKHMMENERAHALAG